MKMIQTIRQFFKTPKAVQRFEYVRETVMPPPVDTTHCATAEAATEMRAPVPEPRVEEIAFSHQGDLESYVRGLAVPKEAIERWISAGVLLPEETRVASKMIRIICNNK